MTPIYILVIFVLIFVAVGVRKVYKKHTTCKRSKHLFDSQKCDLTISKIFEYLIQ